MKITFLVGSLGCGGAERQLVLLASRLAQRHEVSVMALSDEDDFFRPDVEATSIRLISLHKKGRWDVLGLLARFVSEIAKVKPDVIYAFMAHAAVVSLAARLTRVSPRIVWGIRGSRMESDEDGIVSRLLRRMEPVLSPFARLVISNSEAGREHAMKEGFRSSMRLVPNGIDTAFFVRDDEGGCRVRTEWGIPEGAPLIGIVARHHVMKGYETFLRSAALYSRASRSAYFMSVGGGNGVYLDSLKGMARGLGVADRMIWTGRTRNIVPYYSAMDVLASSSSFGEGCSNAIGEAMACGLPCVVTDVGDSRRIVGDTGLVVPAHSPGALSEGWNTMLSVPAHRACSRRTEVRNRIVRGYGVARMVDLTESALVEVLSRPRQG